jgi:hypothetical protein
MQTADLTGDALHYAVARILDVHPSAFAQFHRTPSKRGLPEFAYSECWHLTGPIIERERIAVVPIGNGSWRAYYTDNPGIHVAIGATPLEAGMRAFVQRHRGAVVDIPAELEPLA